MYTYIDIFATKTVFSFHNPGKATLRNVLWTIILELD